MLSRILIREAQEKGLERGLEQGRKQGLEQGREQARKEYQDKLREWAKAKGIDPSELPFLSKSHTSNTPNG